jgi:hypothetical protein
MAPSDWVVRWAPLVTRGPVLDVASGPGRHARFFAARGLEVIAVDRERHEIPGVSFVQADLEDGTPWLFAGRLLYETFMIGNERFGRPSNPDFLLRPGELVEAFASLNVLGFEQGQVERPKAAVTQRLCAVNAAKKG